MTDTDVSEFSTAPGAYRPDIDGLRTVAVGSVVAYHFFPVTAHGGFIGVDIFFVISGFLITSILAREIGEGGVAFADFYARRARRIFPALAVVLLAALLFGAVLLDPEEFRALGLHVAAGAGFVSNALLWSQSGYFDEAAEFKPLLHLWSLAIEEQFYLFWPLALWLGARWRLPLWALALGIGAASFALNLDLAQRDAVADFYFVGARIWELLIGAMLALAPKRLRALSPAAAHALSLLGGALILVSLWRIDAQPAFPGWRALGPTLGATLLIAAGPRAILNARLLSPRLMIALGKISYPIYLWHWPLLAFARISQGGHIPPPASWGLIALAIVLAQLTYRFIERPVRSGARGARSALGAAAAIAALGAVGLWDHSMGGIFFPDAAFVRTAHEGDIGQTKFREYMNAHTQPCPQSLQAVFARRSEGVLLCGQSIAGATPEIMFVGDSHVENFFLGVAEASPGRNVGYYLRNALPFVEDSRFTSVYRWIASEPKLHTVIVSVYWLQRLHDLPAGARLRDKLNEIAAPLTALGKRVYFVLDVPNFQFRVTQCKYEGRLGAPQICDENRAAFDRRLASYAGELEAVAAANPMVRVLDAAHLLCDEKRCSMTANGKLLYRDDHHLNIDGSRLIGAKLLSAYPEIAD